MKNLYSILFIFTFSLISLATPKHNIGITHSKEIYITEIPGLKIFPNPATNYINIISNDAGLKNVEIFDVLGKQVLKTVTEQTVNVSSLLSGIYMVKVTQEGKTSTRKLVIK